MKRNSNFFMFSRTSIFSKLLILIFAAVLIQTVLFFSAIFLGGTLERIEENAFDIMNEKVANRTRDLENEMVQRWSSLDETTKAVRAHTAQFLQEHRITSAALIADDPQTSELLSLVSDDLIYALRKNSVTGVFIVFEGDGGYCGPTSSSFAKAGLYFRDSDPTTTLDNNSDLLAERAPSSLAKSLNIPMDSYWYPHFEFTADNYASGRFHYYYEPLQAAVKHPEISSNDLGYWSKPFTLPDDSVSVITYSKPLIADDGTVLGVLGVELSCDYLSKKLPYQDLNSNSKGAYLLAQTDSRASSSSSIYTNLVRSGPILNYLLGTETDMKISLKKLSENTYSVLNAAPKNDRVYACIHPLQLYNTNTPFEHEQWALIGVEGGNSLLAFANSLRHLLMLTLAISLIIGLIFAYFSSATVTRPITALVQKLKKSSPHQPLHLGKININEIDELSSTIETLSQDVADSASKLSHIIEMAGISISAFEYAGDNSRVFCTNQFFSMVNHAGQQPPGGYVDRSTFQHISRDLEHFLEAVEHPKGEENSVIKIYRMQQSDGAPKWLRLKEVISGARTQGVLTDITQETIEKKKIEHDRDYDLLTDLYNRRAFYQEVAELFLNPQKLKTAVLIMLDLDNLKYINDTYGHDYGDQYIRCAADHLQQCSGANSVVSRMAGDEFLIFLYGFDSRSQAEKRIGQIRQSLIDAQFILPDQTETRVRASAGYAWYPDDARDYEMLIRYADFAMYLVKRTTKGEFAEFNLESYNKGSYLLHSKEELNTLIEQKQISFAFQPIIDAKTGEVYAYEALMRPNTPSIRTPMDLLRLARSQSKLHEIERLTFFRALECFSQLSISQTNCKLFINSISNQILEESDIRSLEARYSAYLGRMVIELTEEERLSANCGEAKQELALRWNCGIAMDDFGSGFNGETTLLTLKPDLVKLDMTLVRNIHIDENRRNLLQTMTAYMRDRGILVVAEGVECREELETLIDVGVDYLQGFYLGMPDTNPQGISVHITREIQKVQGRCAALLANQKD